MELSDERRSRLSLSRIWIKPGCRARGLLIVIALCLSAAGADAHLSSRASAPRPVLLTAEAQDITQAQADLYERWRSNIRNNQTLAYEAGKEYLSKYPSDEYAAYVRKWVEEYERVSRRLRFQQLLLKDKKFGEAFAVGKQVLADDPENLKTLINLAYAGYFAQAASDPSLNHEALDFARKSITQIEAGNQPADWKPFTAQSDALGYLHFIVGDLLLKDAPADAAQLFLKALQYEGSIKSYPVIYARLAAVYAVREFDPLARDFEARYSGRDVTPESKAALEKVYQIVDKIIDAYARAVALSGTEAQYDSARSLWREELTRFYKSRHNNSTDGLDALIANALSKPLI